MKLSLMLEIGIYCFVGIFHVYTEGTGKIYMMVNKLTKTSDN